MVSHSAVPPMRPVRRASRRLWRGLAIAFVVAGLVLAALALRPTASEMRVGTDTRFDYVAVFPAGTAASAVEAWRQRVLRVHGVGCFRGNPCVARSLRGAELGPARQFAIGFDLMRDAPPDERAALLAAAQQAAPGVRIAAGSSLQQAVD